VLRACGIVPSRVRFAHGAMHTLPDGLVLANSYHVSRYNTSTRRLTTEMFEAVMIEIGARLHAA
jgi:uracil-DNA glycosylase